MTPENMPIVPISRRMMIVPLVLITVFTIAGFWFIDQYLDRVTTQLYEKNLVILASSGAEAINLLGENAGIKEFDNLADTFTKNSLMPLTILDATGAVLGDSQLNIQKIQHSENYSNYPEIVQARDSGIGIAKRHSKTLNMDLLFVAVRYDSPNHKGYFRIALPLSELDNEKNRQRLVVGGFCFLALCIVAILSLLISRYFLSLIKKGKHDLEQIVMEKNRQIEIMNNFISQLTACNSTDEVIKVIDVTTSLLMPQVSGAIALIRASRDKLEVVGSWNGNWPGEPSYFPDECWALRTGKPHIGNDGEGKIICSHAVPDESKTMCIPLIAHGETLGVIHFFRPKDMEWSPVDHQIVYGMAEHTSITLANLQLRESLRQQAIRDPLTGLYNRRYLMEAITHELSRVTRNKQSLGVLMIDLDHFKKFNDKYGHEIGDFILSEFGRLVRTIIRSGDTACRYGGEEFVILLPETDHEGVSQTANKILSRVREHDFILNNHSYGPVTLSIGTAIFPDNGKTPEDLLNRADEALYEAKRSGRDRVMTARVPE